MSRSLYHFDPENPPIPSCHRRQPKPTIVAEDDEKTVSMNANCGHIVDESAVDADSCVDGDHLKDVYCENEPSPSESYVDNMDLAGEVRICLM